MRAVTVAQQRLTPLVFRLSSRDEQASQVRLQVYLMAMSLICSKVNIAFSRCGSFSRRYSTASSQCSTDSARGLPYHPAILDGMLRVMPILPYLLILTRA